MKRRWALGVVAVLLGSLAAVNGVAWMHARALTTFVEGGTRTPNPEDLSAAQKLKVLLFGARIPKPNSEDRLPNYVGELATTQTTSETSNGQCFLFHGYAGSRDQIAPTASVLGDWRCHTYQVDFRGHGDSPGHHTSVGWREAEDVVEVVNAARDEGPVILYGFSMGAAAILRAAGPLGLEADAIIVEGCFGRFETTLRSRFATMGLPSSPGAELLMFWGGRRVGFDARAHNPQQYIAQVDAPVLVLHGAEDPRVTSAEAQALGEHGELVVTEGLGHQQLAEADRAAFRAILGPFLNEHLGY